ncbi:hypothetical protein BC834DRAFT_883395 [Gloeopeniophorella convolvens]|nr:hypothetical protein BC834DRAFT_883395 [Gloeopeniophorella convolvens]
MPDILEKAGRKLFARHLQQYTPADPLYENYVDKRGRTKRRKRELPPGLSDRDAKILLSVKRRAHYLDKGFNLCGMRFGWTFIIGIVPGVGDAADAALGYFLVVRKARKAELPRWLTQRMMLNLGVATSVGLVPLVGDVLLAAFRANSRNAALLEEYLRVRAAGAPAASGEASGSGVSSVAVDKGIARTAREEHRAQGGDERDEPLVVREAAGHELDSVEGEGEGEGADADAPLPERKRSWPWQRGGSSGGSPDKDKGKARSTGVAGAGAGTVPGGLEAVGQRGSRFVEDVS